MSRISTASGVASSWVGATAVLSCIDDPPKYWANFLVAPPLFCSRFVGNAIGGRRRGAANHANQCDQRSYIGNRTEEIWRNTTILPAYSENFTQSKDKASKSSSQGGIFTKNHGSQCDIT